MTLRCSRSALTNALGYATRTAYNGLSQTAAVTGTPRRVTGLGYDGSGTLALDHYKKDDPHHVRPNDLHSSI